MKLQHGHPIWRAHAMKTRPPSSAPRATRRVRRHGHEVSGGNRDLFVINDHHTRSAQYGVCILGTVVTVVVSNGLSATGKLHLVEPEGADAQRVADALVELAGRRMIRGRAAPLTRCTGETPSQQPMRRARRDSRSQAKLLACAKTAAESDRNRAEVPAGSPSSPAGLNEFG
jgi:hypothetical protein